MWLNLQIYNKMQNYQTCISPFSPGGQGLGILPVAVLVGFDEQFTNTSSTYNVSSDIAPPCHGERDFQKH
jgi:hypothetical protein